MARIRYNHNSFSLGVLSKKIHGNTDFEGYNNALAECVNFIVRPTGGLFKRPGTVFVSATKLGAAVLKLFTCSASEQYICEFGDKYIRFHTKDDGPLTDGENVIEVKTPFSMEECRKIRTFQDGNVMYIVSSAGIYSLKKTAKNAFRLSSQPIEYKSEPMTFERKDGICLKPNTDTGTIVFHAVNRDGKLPASKMPYFYDSDVGHSLALRYKEFDEETGVYKYKTLYLKIEEVSEDEQGYTQLSATIDKDKTWDYENIDKLPNLDEVERWQIGAFNEDRGRPRSVAMYEGRLFLASNDEIPNGIWGSAKFNGDWTDFYPGTLDTDGVMFKISDQNVDEIIWLAAHTKLFAGTKWGIYLCGSATYNDMPITPSNFQVKMFESTGACDLQPVMGVDSVFYVDVSRKKLFEIHLDENGFYRADDMSLLSTDLTQSGIIAHTWQQCPIQTYWCVVDDGYLCSLTYLKSNGIVAWVKHVIGGNNVKVEDICTMRGDKNDLIWLVVRREIDGKFVRHIEYIHPIYDPQQQEEFKQFYVDSGVTKNLKYDIVNISRSTNPELTFHITNDRSDILEALIASTGGALPVAFVWTGKMKPPDNILSKRRCFALDNAKLNENNLRGVLYDDFEYIFSKNPRSGKPRVKYGKIDPNYFSDTGESNKNFNLYVKVADVLEIYEDGQKIKCDTQFIQTGADIIFYDSSTKPGIDYDNGGKTFFVGYKDAEGIIVADKDGETLRILHPTKRGAIFMKCCTNTTFAVKPSNCIITLEDSLQQEVKKYTKVYINKVNGMNQINQREFKVCSISEDRKKLTLYAPDQSPSDKYLTVLDTDGYSPFDDVNPNGNMYIYFETMAGLQHLKGQEVAVCMNGNSISNRTVAEDGTIQLPHEAMYCSVGLPIESLAKTLPFSGGSMLGSSVGCVGGQKAMWINLYYSLGGQYGTTPDRLYDIPYQKFITDFDKPKSLVSGLIKCPLVNAGDVFNRYVCIKHSEPLAFNILSITQDIQVSDS